MSRHLGHVTADMAPPGRTTRNNSSSDTMTVDQKLDLLISEVSEFKAANIQVSNDIFEIKKDIKQFKEDINKSLDLCYEKVEDCREDLNNCKIELGKCETAIFNLTSDNAMLKKEILGLKKSLRISEQYSRSNCLEVWGVPETKNESVLEVLRNVGSCLGFELKDSMVDTAHRLARNPNKPEASRGIIVKFCRRTDMEALRERSKVRNGFSAQNLGFNSDSKVFINLSLSKDTRILWAQTRKFKEENKYKFAWISSSGKIFVRKEEGSKAMPITDSDDLKHLK